MKMAKSISQFARLLQESISHSQIARNGYDKWFGHSINVVSASEGACVAEMTVGEEHMNVNGYLHGGCTATLVDMVTAAALSTTGKQGVSIEISVSYLKGAKLGEVILLDAKTLRIGKTLAFLSLDITKKEDGSLIATGKHVVFLDRPNATAPLNTSQ